MTKDEAIQVLANFYVSTKNPKANHLCEAVYIAIQALKNEPKHGRWEFIGGYGYQYRCSNCIKCAERKTLYCPNCGAIMDE